MCGQLGDNIETALTKIGVTQERVSRWIGQSCNCQERKEKLNRLSLWATRVVSGKLYKAKTYLQEILEERL